MNANAQSGSSGDGHHARLRDEMVERQIRGRVRDSGVLRAMKEVPRHLFVPPQHRDRAYADRPLRIGSGQTISQPLMVAILLEALELDGSERVLDVGTGSGYQAALLTRLAREVYSIEVRPELADSARRVLEAAGYPEVVCGVGDGSLGWREHAPYDAIVVAAAAPEIPRELIDQLTPGGRLVIPVGRRFLQRLVRVRRGQGGELESRDLGYCSFVPLLGESGYPG